MPRSSVDPEAPRSTAAHIEGVRDSAGSFVETCPADIGHAAAAKAISLLAVDTADAWRSAVEDLGHLVERLRQSADLYESTDEDLAVPGETVER